MLIWFLSIHPHSDQSTSFIMSVIKAEQVNTYLFDAIATGRPKLEISVDGETVVKTDPDSVYYNGPFVKDVTSVKEEANDDPVCFSFSMMSCFIILHDAHRKFLQRKDVNVVEKMMQSLRAPVSGEVSSADLYIV